MKGIQKRLGSLLMAAVMLLSMAVTPAMAAGEKEPPTEVTASSNFGYDFRLTFSNGAEWLSAITKIEVDGTAWNKVSSSYSVWNDKDYYVDAENGYLYIGEDFSANPATCVISAAGYNDLTLKLNKTNHTVEVVENSGSNSGSGGSDSGNSGSDSGNTGSGEATKNPPAEMECAYTSGFPDMLTLTVNDSTWLAAVAAKHATLAVNNMTYTYEDNFGTFCSDNYWHVKGNKIEFVVASSYSFFPAVFTLSADGYKDVKITVLKTGNWPNESVSATVEIVDGSGSTEQPDTPEKNTIDLSKVSFAKSFGGNDWQVTFGEDGYAEKITAVTVNGKLWNATSSLADGGKYKISDGKLLFARNSYGGTAALKSGDVITITADGYKDLTFKLVINTDGSASVEENDGKGDPLELHVKLVGSFEAAIVGQKNYDGVSSASVGGASSNKNSAVTVYGALVKKGNDPTDKDWEKLNNESEIRLVGSKCSVSIVPDTSVAGMTADKDSGMKGVYMTLSSDLTLNGTPKDAGSYLISIHVEDNQGRTADSNELPFRIYTGEETLADQIKNLKQYSNGLYAWDIMEPWAIKNFGSNVEGQNESVRVPKDLEVWYGSHQSGTYGYLGYDQEWEKVEAGEIPQTLYIPNGCNLTLVNMEILSSVRIVVEDGGKLTLRDSTVQGIIDVKNGGTFSMNYDSYKKVFETGASICGQLRLENGAVLENAAIYSHTNYLADGDLTDRSNDEAVVLTTGDVTVKGQVFISGDEAGSTGEGQTALKVQNGTLTLEDGAVLATYGGGGNVTLFSNGGSAIKLDNGTISGNGKVIALGGSVLFGSGNSAVSGTGTITTAEAYIQGATAYNHAGKNAQPGKSHDASVAINSGKKYVANGTLVDGTNDPLADLYWKSSIDATPDLSKYEIPANSGYVLMNIPYAEFYAAEKDADGTAAQVDAVSSATKQKTRSTLAAGSYHKKDDGSDISGVIYPVYVADLSILKSFTQVTDKDSLTITVTLKGKERTTTYTGKNALFENPDYAYYVLSEVPTSYKTLTVEPDGSFSFGKATAKAVAADGVTVSLKTGSRHTYYKLKVTDGLPEDIASMVSAVTLHTKEDNKTYGLRHVAEIWCGAELGFGVDSGLQGKTIDKITYYLNDGTIQTIAANIKVPKSTKNVTATVENALNTAREAVVTVENLPADFVAEYTVTSGSTVLSAYNFTVANGKLTWTGTPAFGTYTLTITDKSDVYAPVSTSFELKTADVIAKYDASKKALVKASDAITEGQFAAYLKAISAVSVDATSYAASGKGAVTIIKDGGVIDLTAQPFSKGEGASYSLVVKATGYQDLTFTAEVPKQNGGSSGGSSSGGSSSSDRSYAVSVPSAKNGDVTVSPKNTSKGDRVTITVTPDKGYELDSLTVKDASGNKLKLTDKGNGKYTFTMPGSKVTVSAEFVEEQAASIFADVPTDAYYAKAVEWAVKKDITNGKANGLFGSNDPCTRGQIVTFLWRAAGSPAPKGTAKVPADVLPGSYCYDAVAWALENSITNGLADGTFGVNSTCTRGQSVTFLYRAMGTAPTTVNGFTDVAAGDFYAEAVAWAVENGVTSGTSASTFSPNAGCTRAQIVTFLYRAYQSK